MRHSRLVGLRDYKKRLWCKIAECRIITEMTSAASVADLFKGRQFDQEIIDLCVRWYLRYKLSTRDLSGNDGGARSLSGTSCSSG